MKEFIAKMEQVKAHVAVINGLHARLVAWVHARVTTSIRDNGGKLLAPDAEEHRILASIDQQKAKTREFINLVLRTVMDAERRQSLIDLREAVKKMALDIRLDGTKKEQPLGESPFGDGLSGVADDERSQHD